MGFSSVALSLAIFDLMSDRSPAVGGSGVYMCPNNFIGISAKCPYADHTWSDMCVKFFRECTRIQKNTSFLEHAVNPYITTRGGKITPQATFAPVSPEP